LPRSPLLKGGAAATAYPSAVGAAHSVGRIRTIRPNKCVAVSHFATGGHNCAGKRPFINGFCSKSIVSCRFIKAFCSQSIVVRHQSIASRHGINGVCSKSIVSGRFIKAFYQRLRAAGKPAKVALTAVMRKLIVLMNHILKNPNFALQN
jgi:hypothetical protein